MIWSSCDWVMSALMIASSGWAAIFGIKPIRQNSTTTRTVKNTNGRVIFTGKTGSIFTTREMAFVGQAAEAKQLWESTEMAPEYSVYMALNQRIYK